MLYQGTVIRIEAFECSIRVQLYVDLFIESGTLNLLKQGQFVCNYQTAHMFYSYFSRAIDMGGR